MSYSRHFGIFITGKDGKGGWVENLDGFVFWTTSAVVAGIQLERIKAQFDGTATVREFTDETGGLPQPEH
jgi:hypothetical protein